jgi:hypothetical protein
MKLKYLLLTILIGSMLSSTAQKFITKTGVIEINSKTPVYTIKGVNNKVASILDAEIGEIFASTLIRSFQFKEALVEERFNENYMEPDKYPNSTFQGKITDYKKIDFSKNGTYVIMIEGKLTIHGVTNYIKERGKLIIKDGVIVAKTEVTISLKAYEINVEDAYQLDEVLLKIRFNYQPYNI